MHAFTDYFSMIQGVESTSVVIHMHDMYDDTHSDGIAWANMGRNLLAHGLIIGKFHFANYVSKQAVFVYKRMCLNTHKYGTCM